MLTSLNRSDGRGTVGSVQRSELPYYIAYEDGIRLLHGRGRKGAQRDDTPAGTLPDHGCGRYEDESADAAWHFRAVI